LTHFYYLEFSYHSARVTHVHIFAPPRGGDALYSFSKDRSCNSKPPTLGAPNKGLNGKRLIAMTQMRA
jgi:hypothetical protein